MRYVLALFVSGLTLASLHAQPPTKVERESQEDIFEDSKVSTASARGSAVANRRYAPTPSMQEARRRSEEIAGAPRPSPYRYAMLADSEREVYLDDPAAFDDDHRPLRTDLLAEDGTRAGQLYYTYGEDGQLSRIDRYRPDSDRPFASYGYRYTKDRTVVEEELLNDGTRRLVRELPIDDFRPSVGPGNTPQLDNRPTNQYNSVPNEPSGTPSMPRGGN